MGTGKYYGISDSAEEGSADLYGKAAAADQRGKIQSPAQEQTPAPAVIPENPGSIMRADVEEARGEF